MHQFLTIARGIRLVAVHRRGSAARRLRQESRRRTGGLALGVSIERRPRPAASQDFVVNVGDRVFFETDSTDLTATAAATLDRQAQWLHQYPRYTFTVEGHADERGTREYNIALGARRATDGPRLPRRRAASPRTACSTISYGKERPVAVCNDISCWSQNRRAVTVLNNAGV